MVLHKQEVRADNLKQEEASKVAANFRQAAASKAVVLAQEAVHREDTLAWEEVVEDTSVVVDILVQEVGLDIDHKEEVDLGIDLKVVDRLEDK